MKRLIALNLFAISLVWVASVGIAPLPRITEEVRPSDISCEQIPVAVKWAQQKFVAGDVIRIKERRFGKKVFRNYVELLDPYKVLFLKSEIEAHAEEAATAWERLVSKGECSYFLAWFQQQYQARRGKLSKDLESLPYQQMKILEKDPKKAENPRLAHPDHFPKDAAEQSARINELATKTFEHTYPSLLKAYGNDRLAYLKDSLETLLFEEKHHPIELIAKSAMKGLDAYSTYFTEAEFEEFYDDLSGGTSGIGVQVRKVPSGLLIEQVLEKSPAGKSKKIAVGDIITKVGETSLAGLTVVDARQTLKGQEGSDIALHLKKKDESEKIVTLKRENFIFEEGTISHSLEETEEGKILTVVIPSFYGRGSLANLEEERSVSEDLEKILKEQLAKHELAGVMLDLRGNPGGYLEEAISMAGLFLGDLPVVGVVEDKKQRVYRDKFQAPLYTGPLAVLLDYDSASASEILAGALKDYGRALLIGVGPSYGKGSIQRMYHLQDEIGNLALGQKQFKGVIKVTTSLFYSPTGKTPTLGGIQSDIVLPDRTKDRERAKPFDHKIDQHAVSFYLPDIEEEVGSKKIKKNTIVSLLKMKSDARRKWSPRRSEEKHEQLVLDESLKILADYSRMTDKDYSLASHFEPARNAATQGNDTADNN